jgi:uncharacterized protein (DUF849 family)
MVSENTSGTENTSQAQRLRYVVIGAGAGIMHAHVPDSKGNHLAIYRDFYHAILQGHTDYISGEQAAMELELANAMNYSSYHHCELTLPLDRQQYSTFLEDLQQKRKFIQ